MTIFLKQFSKS